MGIYIASSALLPPGYNITVITVLSRGTKQYHLDDQAKYDFRELRV